ncbi:MAG TPA: polyphosphate kinase [Myxococcota bacterium]
MSRLRLADFENAPRIDRDVYDVELEHLQHQIELIQAAYIQHGQRAIIAVEGWDAGGKGGLIRRMIENLDPRFTKVWSIGAPTKQELEHHYLQRFWTRLPGAREIAVFDRTWYGRVLVERVDELTPKAAWQRAYDELNDFEALQVADGARVVKLFLHVTQEVQDRRLKERITTPYKRWKTGLDDFHNRSRRDAYVEAYEEMFAKTSTSYAPWTVIAGDDKKTARIAGMRAVVDTLIKDLKLDFPPVDKELRRIAEKALGIKVANAS